jgi:hypothetical protein
MDHKEQQMKGLLSYIYITVCKKLRCWAEIEIDARNEKTAKNKENRE